MNLFVPAIEKNIHLVMEKREGHLLHNMLKNKLTVVEHFDLT